MVGFAHFPVITRSHPRAHQSCGATLAASLMFSAERPWCDRTVETELLQPLQCVLGQEGNDHWCSLVAPVLQVINTSHK